MTIFTAADLAELVEPDDVCLDIGAGTGRHTRRMAALVRPFGHVHAFEPRPLTRLVLRARTWPDIQVTVVDPAAARTVDGYCEQAGIKRVAVIRVAAALTGVLAGTVEMLQRDRPLLVVERPRGADPSAQLRCAGYRIHGWHGHWQPVERIDATSRTYLCTPPSVVRLLPTRVAT